MKAKCVKSVIDFPNNNILNGDMSGYINLGMVYYIFGVRILNETIYVMIYNENHLFEVPIELFEIIENNIPSEWEFRVNNNNEIILWPKLFFNVDFFENFAEREFFERQEFEILKHKIENIE